MCTSPEQIRGIVREELDSLMLDFMEKVNKSIDARVVHIESSPQTRAEIDNIKKALEKHDREEREHWVKIDSILEFQKSTLESIDIIKKSAAAINAVNDLLAGGRMLQIIAKIVGWIGTIVVGIVALKVWIVTK